METKTNASFPQLPELEVAPLSSFQCIYGCPTYVISNNAVSTNMVYTKMVSTKCYFSNKIGSDNTEQRSLCIFA